MTSEYTVLKLKPQFASSRGRGDGHRRQRAAHVTITINDTIVGEETALVGGTTLNNSVNERRWKVMADMGTNNSVMDDSAVEALHIDPEFLNLLAEV